MRTYDAGDTGSSSEMICPACGRRFTAVKLILHEIEKRGQGAFAVAQRVRRGQLRVKDQKHEPERP